MFNFFIFQEACKFFFTDSYIKTFCGYANKLRSLSDSIPVTACSSLTFESNDDIQNPKLYHVHASQFISFLFN